MVTVSASVPRLLLALFLACSGVLVTQLPAAAGPVKDAQRADLVFSGTVTEVTGSGRKATYAVAADRIWKGILTKPDVEVDRASGQCPLELDADATYVFFVTDDGGDLVTSRCDGTTKATQKLERTLDRVLGESTPIEDTQPETQSAEFTLVEGAEPETFARLAAPGAALVLLGLLGLVFFGRAAKRR